MPPDGAPESMEVFESTAAVAELLLELLRRTHLSAPSDVAAIVADQATSIGASDVVTYLVDYESRTLVPLPATDADRPPALSVAGTVAGRAFSSTTILRTPVGNSGGQRLWLPLLDGTERLGVLAMSFAADDPSDALVTASERYAHLVAMLIATKGMYGDAFEVTRRQRPMTIASELVWGLAPPLVFATDDLTLAGMLEPSYDNGGDTFDYAVNDRVLHLGIFDAMGHGLAAAGVAAFALAAYRQSRRVGSDLGATYTAMDEAVGQQFPDSRFVTAVIAQLDIDSGHLSWISAGHPQPLLIRGRRARTLEVVPSPPLGIDFQSGAPTVGAEALQPGDQLLFYTDGLTDARSPDGDRFTLETISELIEREASAGQAAPETLRRIRHALIGRRTELRDDATALLVEWRRDDDRELMPQTVL
jgi:hypothetical protein